MCILVELYTGEMLFPTHENIEHLAMIEKISGPIPKWMTQNTSNGEGDPKLFENIWRSKVQ